MKTKVVKFGGSSLCDAGHFAKVAKIIKDDPVRRYVVVSAPGKRFSDDIKVTDLLLLCYEEGRRGEDISAHFSQLEKRFSDIIEALGLSIDLTEDFRKIRFGMAHHVGRDYVVSRGEFLCAKMMAEYLKYDFVDAESLICFKEDGTPDLEKTQKELSRELKKHESAVIPGFYGSMPNGTLKTFSRGGSDTTGALVARAVDAMLYENWTDVSGFLIADPRIVEHPKPIRIITYRELRELTYMGASVLHEDAIFPVRYAGIPINIRNTECPEDPGSLIVANAPERTDGRIITGIAGKTGFSIIAIEKEMMNSEVGFGRKVLEVFEKHHLCFEHLPSGIDTMSVIMHTKELTDNREEILREIDAAVSPDTLYVEDHIALIAVVGRGMIKAKGTAAKIFEALADAQINIKMIDQGSSELNIIIGVDEADFSRAVRAIYLKFEA